MTKINPSRETVPLTWLQGVILMDDTKPTNVVPMYIACAKWFISSQINDLHFSLLAGPDLLLQFSSTGSSRIKILGRGPCGGSGFIRLLIVWYNSHDGLISLDRACRQPSFRLVPTFH